MEGYANDWQKFRYPYARRNMVAASLEMKALNEKGDAVLNGK
jgi:hypothetical protein